MSETSPENPPEAAAPNDRLRASRHTRALSELADRQAVTLESLLAALRSPRLGDREAREAAISVAAAALVEVRSAEKQGSELLEPVTGAFARLKSELSPMMRYGRVAVEFVEPPSNGRALPGDVARAARAVVRSAVLTLVDSANARRVRVHWDCDGLHLLMHIRDDGDGELGAHDDALRPIADHVSAFEGRMGVESTLGWGTEISIAVPLDPVPAPLAVDDLGDLSPREAEVLQHLGRGARNAAIAEELGISGHTVKFHISNLLRKTGARSRAELIALLR
ncbi:LuxR C-terminal-related transcriptional regulator [Nesterenkonia sp. F]|uniref:helix-turn-helix transcriptional regulator n=1 Tax=Nesterenkonia sp. F TaxID=795955 RepID=UPI000255D26E|nr:LuxR C-terminal-related transcriptional regulator [Nesterenkonia sp. F]